MKILSYFIIAAVSTTFFTSCASSKGETWVVTNAKANHFQNQHTKRWYKLEKGDEAHVGDSLLFVQGSKSRFVKVGTTVGYPSLNNTLTKNNP